MQSNSSSCNGQSKFTYILKPRLILVESVALRVTLKHRCCNITSKVKFSRDWIRALGPVLISGHLRNAVAYTINPE